MGDLSNNFSKWEFKCQCGCGICNVGIDHINKLQTARTIANIRFKISSGCRCPMHNKLEGGKFNSDHITTETIQCQGTDIYCYSSSDRFRIIEAAILAKFRRIGISKNFIHLGTNLENPQEVIWLY